MTPPAETARIVIVDDHPLVRERLTEVIHREPGLRVCGEAEDRPGAVEVVSREKPDLVIVDLTLKRSNGLDLIKDLRVLHPDLRILVLSMQDESLYAERVVRAGAHGYITKYEATERILLAIHHVLSGKMFLSAEVSDEILSRMLGKPKTVLRSVDLLSDRELQVFELVGRGYSTRQIAEFLGLDGKTVETYRSRIKEKLDIKDASELLRRAIAWTRESGEE